mmetsp:Transcript_12778/g.46742  ORF Transcript_12778/g.46742 Transcript_12778/m.46742 type:complete len:200 (-) Transcript_12778:490-1089(-)
MSNAPNWATAERTRQLADASGGVTGSPPVRCVKASRSIRQNVLSPSGPQPAGSSMRSPAYARLHVMNEAVMLTMRRKGLEPYAYDRNQFNQETFGPLWILAPFMNTCCARAPARPLRCSLLEVKRRVPRNTVERLVVVAVTIFSEEFPRCCTRMGPSRSCLFLLNSLSHMVERGISSPLCSVFGTSGLAAVLTAVAAAS